MEKKDRTVLRPTVIWPIGNLAYYILALSNLAQCNLAQNKFFIPWFNVIHLSISKHSSKFLGTNRQKLDFRLKIEPKTVV